MKVEGLLFQYLRSIGQVQSLVPEREPNLSGNTNHHCPVPVKELQNGKSGPTGEGQHDQQSPSQFQWNSLAQKTLHITSDLQPQFFQEELIHCLNKDNQHSPSISYLLGN